MKIYLIDDNAIDLEINRKALAKADPNLTFSLRQDPVQALEELVSGKAQPDVILLDWLMDPIEGEAWLQLYTELMAHPVPVYILTSSILWKDKQCAEKFSVVQGHFIKPLKHEAIGHFLKNIQD